MCLLLVKPKGVTISERNLALMWAANPDGAGLAYRSKKGIEVIKGMMTLEEVKQSLLYDVGADECVLHFRYATHGQKIAEQTHPFVVSPDRKVAEAMGTGAYPTEDVFFHNGILSMYGDKDISDTLDFTMSVLSKLPDFVARVMLLENVGGKFVLFNDEYKIETIGKFETINGLICSNGYWRYTAASYTVKRPSFTVSNSAVPGATVNRMLESAAKCIELGEPEEYDPFPDYEGSESDLEDNSDAEEDAARKALELLGYTEEEALELLGEDDDGGGLSGFQEFETSWEEDMYTQTAHSNTQYRTNLDDDERLEDECGDPDELAARSFFSYIRNRR